MKAAFRDATFYACPAGYGKNPRPPKYHAIVSRPGNKYGNKYGPACGYPFHEEGTETEAASIPMHQRCKRPGCRKAFASIDQKGKP